MSEVEMSFGWSSPKEYFLTEREHAQLQELRVKDLSVGLKAESKHGKQYLALNLSKKLLNRLKFELHRLLSSMIFILSRRIVQYWNLVFLTKRIYKGPLLIESGKSKIQIIDLSVSSKLLFQNLSKTDATHWVFIKSGGQLLKSGLKTLLRSSNSSDKSIFFGDSQNLYGGTDKRPAFSQLLVRQIDFSGPILMVSTSFLKNNLSGQFQPDLWPIEILLKSSKNEIEQLPNVLGVGDLWSDVKDDKRNLILQMVNDDLTLSGQKAKVVQGEFGQREVSYESATDELVSIVIPTKGSQYRGEFLVVNAVKSIIQKSNYPNLEIVVVADNETPQFAIDQLENLAGNNLKLVRWNEPFNFSKKVNTGSIASTGKFLLFLNDDVEVVSPNWIQKMRSLIGVEDIGYVGALLFFEDGTIQHAGHFYESGAGHISFKQPFKPHDRRQLYSYDRLVSGVTAACSLVSREVFISCGGFSENLPGNYNDVDFSLKVSEIGLNVAVCSSARLYHFESKSRDSTVTRAELVFLHQRWYRAIQKDCWYRGI